MREVKQSRAPVGRFALKPLAQSIVPGPPSIRAPWGDTTCCIRNCRANRLGTAPSVSSVRDDPDPGTGRARSTNRGNSVSVQACRDLNGLLVYWVFLEPRQVAAPGVLTRRHFRTAPLGTTPCSTKRHRATRSFLASATMPTRRHRLLPRPNFCTNHKVSSLRCW